jgi:Exonuclease
MLPYPLQQEQPPPLQASLPKVKAKCKCGLCGDCGQDHCNCPHKPQGGEMMMIFQTLCHRTAKNTHISSFCNLLLSDGNISVPTTTNNTHIGTPVATGNIIQPCICPVDDVTHTNVTTIPPLHKKRPFQASCNWLVPVNIDLAPCFYVVFDIETTEFSQECNYIIKIAAEFVNKIGAPIKHSSYQSLVKPPVSIPWKITQITGIKDTDVEREDTIHDIGKNSLLCIADQVKGLEVKTSRKQ